MLQDVEEERLICGDTTHAELLQSALQLLGGLLALGRLSGDLDEEGVVVRRDLGARESRSVVEADAHARRHPEDVDSSGVRPEVVGGVLGCHADLHGVAAARDLVLGQSELGKSSPRCDLDLRLDDINSGDFLRDGVFHLDAGIDLNEVVAALLVDQELHSSRVLVLGGGEQPHGIVEEGVPGFLRQAGGGGALDDLLVPALDGAVAVEEVDHSPGSVSEALHLNVARILDEALDEAPAVAEGCKGLSGG
mmetsp:Transcript_21282/g.39968  ORF Transcript_21282/g.39968 Transcript_21282/m.39968 type:complete len:250 (-) Transcript_21282:845-1594(-)